jgi:hypothetical protein
MILGASLVGGGLVGLLIKVAVACVVIWAIWALLQWLEITIPRPVQIILIALGCILLIYWIYAIFLTLS